MALLLLLLLQLLGRPRFLDSKSLRDSSRKEAYGGSSSGAKVNLAHKGALEGRCMDGDSNNYCDIALVAGKPFSMMDPRRAAIVL